MNDECHQTMVIVSHHRDSNSYVKFLCDIFRYDFIGCWCLGLNNAFGESVVRLFFLAQIAQMQNYIRIGLKFRAPSASCSTLS